jgi:hypothetical protein
LRSGRTSVQFGLMYTCTYVFQTDVSVQAPADTFHWNSGASTGNETVRADWIRIKNVDVLTSTSNETMHLYREHRMKLVIFVSFYKTDLYIFAEDETVRI